MYIERERGLRNHDLFVQFHSLDGEYLFDDETSKYGPI